MYSNITAEALKQEMLKKYPAKVARKREKQILVNQHVAEF